MLAHTKKRTMTGCAETEYLELHFLIPVESKKKIVNALHEYGAKEINAVPWREVFPDFKPGVALAGARHREGFTQKELAGILKISQSHISAMEHGQRPIGKVMAKRLAEVFNTDYRVFV